MVDFRYHLVSIIAIFLALALGIVVGTTALNGALLDSLKSSIDTLSTDKRTLEGTVGQLRDQTASDTQLAERVGPTAVQGQLEGQRVVLVTAPGAPSGVREQLTPLLRSAGATLTGEVRLRPDLLDPARAGVVDAALQAVAGSSARTGTPAERVAALLAGAVLQPRSGSGTGTATTSTTTADQLLRVLSERDLVDVDPDLARNATVAVLLVGDTLPNAGPDDLTERVRALAAVGAALDTAGSGAVLAGPAPVSPEPLLLQTLRDQRGISGAVSTVDGVERPQGRLAVVWALREQAAGGAGRYGPGPGNQGPLPSLPPP